MKIGKYEVRRKYKLAHLVVDIATIGIIFVLLVVFVNTMQGMPKEVPILTNHTGCVLQFANKKILIMPIIISVAATLLSIIIGFFPNIFASKFDASEDNAQKFYDIIIALLNEIRLIIVVMMFDIFFNILSTVNGGNTSPPFFLIGCVIAILIIIRIRIKQIKHIKYE
ncbi:MAG: hypothetical protein GX967_02845 [Clostridiales bacterium]|nr:hypothetical protein [Clostridiales bacterium]